jgi:hypothetical protein
MIQRCAVLYLAHAWSPIHTLRFQRLQRQTESIADCYVLYQSATTEPPDDPRNAARDAIHVFQAPELPRRLGYRYLTQDGLVPGCAHFPLIDFSKSYPYRHYWLIEGDVEFSGNWATLLRAGSATDAGLLASHLRRHRDAPDWVWWGSLRAPLPARLTIPRQIGKLSKAFLPLYRISSDALQLIDRLHRRGCTGHCEVLLPTAIGNAGLGVVDLNSLNALYRGTEQDPASDVASRSTLRWRPEISLAEFVRTFTADTIYHPVKAEWTFDGTNVVVAQPNGYAALSLDAPNLPQIRATSTALRDPQHTLSVQPRRHDSAGPFTLQVARRLWRRPASPP